MVQLLLTFGSMVIHALLKACSGLCFQRPFRVALLFVLFAACSVGAGENSSTRKQTATSAQVCEPLKQAIEAYGGLHTGVLRVPESPERKEEIDVFFYTNFDWEAPNFKANVATDGRLPVVYFNGGPTAPSFHEARIILDKLGEDTRVAVIDQRGTGCSTPFPERGSPDAVRRMRDWATRGIVRDAEALRKKLLGDSPWVPVGFSFGARVVHRYLEDAPEGVASAFASHGGVGHTVPEDILATTVAEHDAWKTLKTRNKDFYDAWQHLRTNFSWEEDCHSESGYRVCGYPLLDFLAGKVSDKQGLDVLNKIMTTEPAPTSSAYLAFQEDPEGVRKKFMLDFVKKEIGFDSDRNFYINAITSVDLGPFPLSIFKDTIQTFLDDHARVKGGGFVEATPAITSRFWAFIEYEDPALQKLEKEEYNLFQKYLSSGAVDLSRIAMNLKKKNESDPNFRFCLYAGDKDLNVTDAVLRTERDKLAKLNNFGTHTWKNNGHTFPTDTDGKTFWDAIRAATQRQPFRCIPD